MKKTASILGVILSLLLVIAGVLVLLNGMPVSYEGALPTGSSANAAYEGSSVAVPAVGSYGGSAAPSVSNGSYSGITLTSTSFGADFYTYSYRATRAAANNVEGLGEYLETTGNGVLTLLRTNANNTYELGRFMQATGGSLVTAMAANANNTYQLGRYLEATMGGAASAARASAVNSYHLGKYLGDVSYLAVGFGAVVFGLFGLLLSLFGLGCAKESRKQLALLEKLAAKSNAPAEG